MKRIALGPFTAETQRSQSCAERNSPGTRLQNALRRSSEWWKAERTTDGLKFRLGVSGHDGMEASLLDLGRSEVDRRVPAGFGVFTRDGRKVGDGALRYG